MIRRKLIALNDKTPTAIARVLKFGRYQLFEGRYRISTFSTLIQPLSTISKALFTVARYAIEYVRSKCACLSEKQIIRKARIINTESLKTAIRNKTGAIRGHAVRLASGHQGFDKTNLTMFVLMDK